jgi:pimeloyl-ACP methyl ester carboxylesterase
VKELFGKSTQTNPLRRPMLEEWTARLRSRPRNIAPSLLAVMNRREFTVEELALVRCPTLIIVGEEDVAQPPRNSESMVAGIRGARMVRIPGAGHSSSIEEPDAVIAAMQELLRGVDKSSAQKNPR